MRSTPDSCIIYTTKSFIALVPENPVGDGLAEGAHDEEEDHGKDHGKLCLTGQPHYVRSRHCDFLGLLYKKISMTQL